MNSNLQQESVMTVNGPIAAEQIGFTLIHEHVFLSILADYLDTNRVLDDPDSAYVELMHYRNSGGVTLVDQTNRGLEQQPNAVREIAKKTGLNIILGCGWYREPFYDQSLYRSRTNAIADEMIKDLNQGIDDTGVRAGLIGELGAHETWVSPVEERVLRAGARAHLETGVTIATHGLFSPVGLKQLDILSEEGVNPNRVIVGHAHDYPYHEYHIEIAKKGAFISFDGMQDENQFLLQRDLKNIQKIVKAGFIHKLLLSHDVCVNSHYEMNGGFGYNFISSRLYPHLEEIGLSKEQFYQIMVENPRNALTGVS